MAQDRVKLEIGVSPEMRAALAAEAHRQSRATGRLVSVSDLARQAIADRFGIPAPAFDRGRSRTRLAAPAA